MKNAKGKIQNGKMATIEPFSKTEGQRPAGK
jgi:hypothetical protein